MSEYLTLFLHYILSLFNECTSVSGRLGRGLRVVRSFSFLPISSVLWCVCVTGKMTDGKPLTALEQKLDELELTVGTMNATLTRVDNSQATITTSQANITTTLANLTARLDHLARAADGYANRLRNLEGNHRVDAIEEEEETEEEEEHPRFGVRLNRNRNFRRVPIRIRQTTSPLPKAVVPPFKGTNVNEYNEWKHKMNVLFDLHHYNGPVQVDLAVSEFTGMAATWWRGSEKKRVALGHAKAQSWEDLIRVMDIQFIPKNYGRDMKVKLGEFKQLGKTVQEYYVELMELTINAGYEEEDDEAAQGRFLQGLNQQIRHKVELTQFDSLEEMVHQACLVEKQIKETSSSRFTNTRSSTSFTKKPTFTQNPPKKNEAKPWEAPRATTFEKGVTSKAPVKPPVKTSTITCYRCQGLGHYAKDCPNARAMVIQNDGGYDSEKEEYSPEVMQFEETYSEEEDGAGEIDEEEDNEKLGITHGNYVVSRSLSVQHVPEPQMEQRRNIFHTRTKVGDKVCLVIIDGGSCANCVSVDFCRKAKIPTEPHPKPYKLQWLDNTEAIKVTRQAKVLLNFGVFTDLVTCDVVPMEACHVLLGRPWEFDHDIVKYGASNKYKVKVDSGRSFTLTPLPPSEIVISQMKIQKEKKERDRIEKENKSGLAKEMPSGGKKVREIGKSTSGEEEKQTNERWVGREKNVSERTNDKSTREKPRVSERKGNLCIQTGNLGRALILSEPLLVQCQPSRILTNTTPLESLPLSIQNVLQ